MGNVAGVIGPAQYTLLGLLSQDYGLAHTATGSLQCGRSAHITRMNIDRRRGWNLFQLLLLLLFT